MDAYADRWALVTGASSGIGAEFAQKLAARGMHLVLVARREERLRELAEELDTKHGTRCEIVALDLTDSGSRLELVRTLDEKNIEVELLVNNAGFAVVGDPSGTTVEETLDLIELNISALTELTEHYLPRMTARKHGAVINVASTAAFQPVAYMASYAASKAYVLHYSEARWAEVKDDNVTVMALCPGVTKTEFFDVAGVPGWLKKQSSQTPEQVVKAALKALDKRKSFVISGWKNSLLATLVRFVPRKIVTLESRKYFRPQNKPEEAGNGDTQESGAAANSDSGATAEKTAS